MTAPAPPPDNVLFVCLGNICRSPAAQGVFMARAARKKITVRADSAGTGDWHVGAAPDPRMRAAAKARGYDISRLRARQVCEADFSRFSHIIAMDRQNLRDLRAMRPSPDGAVLSLLLDHAPGPGGDIPDPYYGGERGFNDVLDMIERAVDGLLEIFVNRDI